MSKSRSRSPLRKGRESYGSRKSFRRYPSDKKTATSKLSHRKPHYNNCWEKAGVCRHSRKHSNRRRSNSDSESSFASVDEKSKSSSRNSRKPRNSAALQQTAENGTIQEQNRVISPGNVGPEPTTTILLRGLSKDVTESDIYQDIVRCNLRPMDIRLMRRKLTGTPRGFAFIQFKTLKEAKQYMDMKKGLIQFGDKCLAIMQYSLDNRTSAKFIVNQDWFCRKCSTKNFQKRTSCYTCQASKSESSFGGAGSDEVCSYPTKTLMLRNLDALTTEESVLTFLNTAIPELVKSVTAVRIGRDPVTSLSLGVCYLSTGSTMDSLSITFALSKVPLIIDKRSVVLSYCKYAIDMVNKVPDAMLEAKVNADVLADTAARLYAGNPIEYVQYLEYHKNYYQGIVNWPSLTVDGCSDQNVNNWDYVAAYAPMNVYTTTAFSPDVNPNWNNENEPVQVHCNEPEKEPPVHVPEVKHVAKTSRKEKNRAEFSKDSIKAPGPKIVKKQEKGFITDNRPGKLNRKIKEDAAAKRITFTAVVASSSNEGEVLGQEWLDFTNKICKLCERRFKTSDMLLEHAKRSELHKCNFKVKEVSKSFDEHMTRLLRSQ